LGRGFDVKTAVRTDEVMACLDAERWQMLLLDFDSKTIDAAAIVERCHLRAACGPLVGFGRLVQVAYLETAAIRGCGKVLSLDEFFARLESLFWPGLALFADEPE
jgi:hypothetical protein